MNLFKKKKNEDKAVLENPWDKFYPEDKRNVDVPDMSIYSYLSRACFNYYDEIAINYYGIKWNYRTLMENIDVCAKALASMGVRNKDVITICMPNTPEAVVMFYAANKIGAIVNLVHPLSSKEEIRDSLKKTNSVFLLAINLIYENIKDIVEGTNIYKTVIVSAGDSMPSHLSLLYWLTNDIKINFDSNELFIGWKEFLARGHEYDRNVEVIASKGDDALYLHSGGTTGTPKNIVLTNGNVNAIAEQARIIFPKLGVGDTFLSILPIFHCFGLVVCVTVPLTLGCTVTLIPKFDAGRFDKLIKKYKPSVLTGVPTLYEALLKNPYMKNYDMSFVKYVISGGDSLSVAKNKEVNDWLKEHNCSEHIMQGYGMTETTGPSSFGSFGSDKLGSIGIPLPGNKFKIVNVETKEEMRTGEIGELLISGPGVMSRYLNNDQETKDMILEDEKGTKWVHTGDLGYMDEDGVIFYVQRLKRMLIVSGYNVYPSHVENTIMKNEYVSLCGVIGIPHPYKIQVPIAYIILKDNVEDKNVAIESIKKYCNENLSRYMIPKKFIIKDSLPKTLIGKINYRELEKMYHEEFK